MATPKDFFAPKSPGNAHGFFKSLPKDLRDIIYEYLYDETSGSFAELGVRISLPVVGLRLINRQFKHEYDQICAIDGQMSHFVLNDDTYSRAKSLVNRWQALTSHITNMAVDLRMCFCKYGCICSVDKRLSETAWRIQKIIEDMPKLRRLRVQFAVAHRRCLIAALK